MRLLPRMYPHVRHQGTGRRERLAACLADMRLLPRMRAHHVRGQVAGPRERLPARLADMRLLPRMCPHMHNQAVGPRERLAARLTDMPPLSLVHRLTTETLLRFGVRRATTSGPPALAHFRRQLQMDNDSQN